MKDEYSEQAMNQAMYYLGVRARTVKQMEDYLIKKQHDEHTIARVMEGADRIRLAGRWYNMPSAMCKRARIPAANTCCARR